MIKIKLKNNTYLFIESDQDSHSHSLTKFKTHTVINYKRTLTGDSNWSENIGGVNVKLLNYEIISTTKDITEEQAGNMVGEVIEEHYQGYKHYHNKLYQTEDEWCSHYTITKESLQSLIQANGLDVNKNYLIFKKL